MAHILKMIGQEANAVKRGDPVTTLAKQLFDMLNSNIMEITNTNSPIY